MTKFDVGRDALRTPIPNDHAAVRIGVVGLRGIPGVMGGVESHVEQLYPRLKALLPRSDIIVAQRASYGDRTRREFHGLALLTLPAVKNKYLEAITHTLIAIFVLKLRCRCTVIHIHAIGPGILAPIARVLGMRVVLTHHGEDYNRAKWNWLAKAALRFGEWLALSTAHQTIAVSGNLAGALRRRFPGRQSRVHFIPNGASPTFRNASREWAPDVLDRFGLSPQQFILGVGRLVPEKGFDDLVAAYRASGETRKLVIAGKADHHDAYARKLLEEADDQVIFVGFQSTEVLRSLYAAASLFVLPSHHEGLPIVALEAAAMGTPMVLSDIPANREIDLPAACYFAVGSIEALAAKLAMAPSAFAFDSGRINAQFHWDVIARATENVLGEAIRGD